MELKSTDSDGRWRFANALLDSKSYQLFVDGAEVQLERKAFELMRFFLINAGKAVTKQEILDAVWPGRIIGDTSLTKCVGHLRKILSDHDEVIIKTVYGRGYRMCAPVDFEQPLAEAKTPCCRILFVEDHELFRAGIKLLLADLSQNLSFEDARTCGEALTKADGGTFDLVILDLGLPGTPSGLEALTLLHAKMPFTSLVVISGEENPQIVRAVMAAGAAAFIPKSSTHPVMVAALRLVLAGGHYVPLYMIVD